MDGGQFSIKAKGKDKIKMSRSVSYANGAFVVTFKDMSDCLDGFEWNWWIEDLQEQIKSVFPSFTNCDKWLDREDHAILENSFAYFGISEYMSLVSLWLVLKDDLEYGNYDQDRTGLAKKWASQVKEKFEKTFGDLVKIGTFSNGEAIYRRRK